MKRLDSILLVEDDKITNYINERLIRRLNIANEIFTATNGYEALNLLNTRAQSSLSLPDLILLDINMPVMDGFEFLQKFQASNFENKDKIKIVMLTTSSHLRDMDKLFSIGNSDIISKPLTEDKITPLLNRYFSDKISQSA